MSLDFALLLFIGVVVTGAIWGYDALVAAPRRRRTAPEAERRVGEPVIVEYSRSFFPVLLAVFLLRSFVVEPFRIPSGSMMPTLLVGDFILVNKFTYGLRLPIVNWKLTEGTPPQRGDVIVFKFPRNESTDYIKRVVGLPGDRIGYYDKTVYVNGEVVPREAIGVYLTDKHGGARMNGALIERELLPGAAHDVLIQPGKPTVEGEFVVPEVQYFVMGDNRDNSNDSRYWGFVPENLLVGRAFMIWMHWDWGGSGIDWGRIGDSIQ
jgi:signal peptidase I